MGEWLLFATLCFGIAVLYVAGRAGVTIWPRRKAPGGCDATVVVDCAPAPTLDADSCPAPNVDWPDERCDLARPCVYHDPIPPAEERLVAQLMDIAEEALSKMTLEERERALERLRTFRVRFQTETTASPTTRIEKDFGRGKVDPWEW